MRPLLFVVLFASIAEAKDPVTSKQPSDFLCGTSPTRTAEAFALNRYQTQKFGYPSSTGQLAVSNDQGNVAIIEDDGTLITRPNFFDLGGTSITFGPVSNGYSVVATSTSAFDDGAGTSSPLQLTDDDSVQVQLPFTFVYYGRPYTSVFVNTDGNLTFNNSDFASSERSLQRTAGGPPRISPLFTDLNPISPARISVEPFAERVLFTWTNTGEWISSGARGSNTFQVILEATGTIRFNYRVIQVLESVVGLSPGGTPAPAISLLDFSNQTVASTQTGLVAEVFAIREQIDLAAVAQYFYRSHEDAYDGLMVFSDFNIELDDAFAFAIHVRNNVRGIFTTTNSTFDDGLSFGSKQRLQVMVNMGTLIQYPFTPELQFLGTNNTVSIIGQEFGHRWLSFVDTSDRVLLGRDRAHWSFFNNSSGSVMEGNEILDLGDGRFRTVGATYRYSPVDQYVMGLRPASEVPPWFVVTNPTFTPFPPNFSFGCRSDLPSCPPYVGADLTGNRRDVTIDEVINVAGPRIPAYPDTQRDFRVAFILLTHRGESPRVGSVAKVDAIRTSWNVFFNNAVDGRGSMNSDMVYPAAQPVPVTELRSAIPINGSQRIETGGLGSVTRAGYASLDSAYGIAVFRSRDAAGIKSEAAVPAATAETSFLLFAERTARTSTGIALVNPGTTAATVTFTLSNGQESVLTMAAGEQRARFIHEVFPSLETTTFTGTASIRSSTPVAVTALRGTLNELSEFVIATVPLSVGPAPANEITVFPQIADGAGYSTELILLNPGASSITGTLEFSFAVATDRGNGPRFAYDIPSMGVWRLRTTNAPAQVAVGFATVIPDSGMARPVSSAIFSLTTGGVLRFQAGVPAQPALTRAVLFGSRNGTERSVMAVVNRGSQTASIGLTAYDETGNPVGSTTIGLQPNAHRAAFLDELMSLPANFRGIVTLNSSSGVHLVTLRSRITTSNSFIMTTMPVVDLNAPPTGTLYLPQLADGGNFTTEVLLLNVTPSTFRLQFFGTDGLPMPLVIR